MPFIISRHAAERRAQRSVRPEDLALLTSRFDVEHDAAGGAAKLGLSAAAAASAIGDGVDPDIVRRASKLLVVVSAHGALITLYRRRGRSMRLDGRGRQRRPRSGV